MKFAFVSLVILFSMLASVKTFAAGEFICKNTANNKVAFEFSISRDLHLMNVNTIDILGKTSASGQINCVGPMETGFRCAGVLLKSGTSQRINLTDVLFSENIVSAGAGPLQIGQANLYCALSR